MTIDNIDNNYHKVVFSDVIPLSNNINIRDQLVEHNMNDQFTLNTTNTPYIKYYVCGPMWAEGSMFGKIIVS